LHVVLKFLACHFLTRDVKTMKQESSLAHHDECSKGDCRRQQSACHGAHHFVNKQILACCRECQRGLISKVWYSSECLYKKPASSWHVTNMFRVTCNMRWCDLRLRMTIRVAIHVVVPQSNYCPHLGIPFVFPTEVSNIDCSRPHKDGWLSDAQSSNFQGPFQSSPLSRYTIVWVQIHNE
jgi:hypothetical protein